MFSPAHRLFWGLWLCSLQAAVAAGYCVPGTSGGHSGVKLQTRCRMDIFKSHVLAICFGNAAVAAPLVESQAKTCRPPSILLNL